MAKAKKSETEVTRVKAKDDSNKNVKTAKPKVNETSKKATSKYAAKVSGKKVKKTRKPAPKFIRIIFKPFISLGSYLKGAWSELKLVRWPSRKETWKMTGSVLGFSIAFGALILSADILFEWLFKLMLGQ